MEVEARGRVGSGEVGGKDKNRRELTQGRGERRRWRREEEVEADVEVEVREGHIVKSSKIVVYIKIII